MRLVRAHLLPYRLLLRQPLETVHGVMTSRRGWLLELETDTGLVGRGDACPFPGFGMQPVDQTGPLLSSMVEALGAVDPRAHEAALARATRAVPEAPGARFALDCALREISAHAEGVSVAEMLAAGAGVSAARSCAVGALVAGRDAAEVEAGAREARARGFSSLKLKLGHRSWSEDRDRVRVLRDVCGEGVKIRLDAGGGWTREQARRRLNDLAEFQIEFVEQPLAADDLEGMAALRVQIRGLGIGLAADESVVRPEWAGRVIEMACADLLILKPAALGGLDVAQQLAARAAASDLTSVVTSLMDSAWGCVAALHLASALPGPRPADGLATGALFVRDLAVLPQPRSGRLEVPSGSGFGLASKASAMSEAADGPVREIRL